MGAGHPSCAVCYSMDIKKSYSFGGICYVWRDVVAVSDRVCSLWHDWVLCGRIDESLEWWLCTYCEFTTDFGTETSCRVFILCAEGTLMGLR